MDNVEYLLKKIIECMEGKGGGDISIEYTGFDPSYGDSVGARYQDGALFKIYVGREVGMFSDTYRLHICKNPMQPPYTVLPLEASRGLLKKLYQVCLQWEYREEERKRETKGREALKVVDEILKGFDNDD